MGSTLTAAKFARAQESWARFMLTKVRAQIDEQETYLRNEKGWSPDNFSDDPILMDLYDDEMFWSSYGEHMTGQREFIRRRSE